MNETFGKEYKLCSKKIIESIFLKDNKIKNYPFVLNFSKEKVPTNKSFQIVISVPKRIFKKAHERNRIKRLIREVVRKKKVSLELELKQKELQLAMFLIYISKEELKFNVLENKIVQLFEKLKKEI